MKPHQIPCSPQSSSSLLLFLNMKKIVLKVELHDEKVKQKAMKVVSGLSGVDSIAMEMKEQRLTVTGDIDPFTIVAKLRKLCHTEIVTVGPAVAEKKKEDNAAGKKEDTKKPEAKKEESAGGTKKKEEPAGGPKKKEEPKKEEAKKKETPNKIENSSQQGAIIPCHQMPYGPYYNYPPAPPPAYNYPPPQQQLYYSQQAYSYQQSPAPTQYYYHRSAEEDPNSCVIC